ncbi:MAG: helix-turn-helix domain-containing protein [Euryarchaeota archaeon]|nr:helix-turn-helix domain-containing protein [Euryarchaeota archaeon]
MTLLHEHPGLDATGVAQRTLAGWSTVIYHLGVLTRNGVIVRLPDGRHRRFFPTNQGKPAERRQVAVLQNSRSGSILQHLRASGALPRSALAAREGVTVPAILWHLRRLQDVGLVTQRTDGNRIVYVAESGATPSTPFSKPEGSGAVAS